VNRLLLLDTMVLSAILKKDPNMYIRLRDEMNAGATIAVSPVVYYEIRRGLLHRDAQRLLSAFDALIAPMAWLEFTRGDWEEAASLWAKVHKSGKPREDADLLIAAQANRRGATVVTENSKHFQDIARSLESWK